MTNVLINRHAKTITFCPPPEAVAEQHMAMWGEADKQFKGLRSSGNSLKTCPTRSLSSGQFLTWLLHSKSD